MQTLKPHEIRRCILNGLILELGKLRLNIFPPPSHEWGLSHVMSHRGAVQEID